MHDAWYSIDCFFADVHREDRGEEIKQELQVGYDRKSRYDVQVEVEAVLVVIDGDWTCQNLHGEQYQRDHETYGEDNVRIFLRRRKSHIVLQKKAHMC